MSEFQNRSMGNKKRQEKMTLQKINNYTKEDLMDSERMNSQLLRSEEYDKNV
jgi:hypothetical protein